MSKPFYGWHVIANGRLTKAGPESFRLRGKRAKGAGRVEIVSCSPVVCRRGLHAFKYLEDALAWSGRLEFLDPSVKTVTLRRVMLFGEMHRIRGEPKVAATHRKILYSVTITCGGKFELYHDRVPHLRKALRERFRKISKTKMLPELNE